MKNVAWTDSFALLLAQCRRAATSVFVGLALLGSVAGCASPTEGEAHAPANFQQKSAAAAVAPAQKKLAKSTPSAARRRNLPLESPELPDDFFLEAGFRLGLSLALDASGKLDLQFGAQPQISPVTNDLPYDFSHATWSTRIAPERVQKLWAAIHAGDHRKTRRFMPRRPKPEPFTGTSGIRVFANQHESTLRPAMDGGCYPSHASPGYFETWHAVRDAIGEVAPDTQLLAASMERLQAALRACTLHGGDAHISLEVDGASGRVTNVAILSRGSAASPACMKRAGREAGFAPFHVTGQVHVDVRARASDGWLTIQSDVAVDVEIDGVATGATDGGYPLSPGVHRVAATQLGTTRHTTTVRMTSGGSVLWHLPSPVKAPVVPADLELGLVHTSADGRHPVYSVRVDASGGVSYQGVRNVRDMGPRHGTIERAVVASLWQEYVALRERVEGAKKAWPSRPVRLFDEGASTRVVAHAQGKTTYLELAGGHPVSSAYEIAAFATRLEHALSSWAFAGIPPADARCAFQARAPQLAQELEGLIRTRCPHRVSTSLRIGVSVLGYSGVLGNAVTSDACVEQMLSLVDFPRCDVPAYSMELELFGSSGWYSTPSVQLDDEPLQMLASARTSMELDGVRLTLLHTELTARLTRGARVRTARPGYAFVLVHLASAPVRDAALPALYLQDATGARWASDREAMDFAGRVEDRGLHTLVFEAPRALLINWRALSYDRYGMPRAKVSELHEDARLVGGSQWDREGSAGTDAYLELASARARRFRSEANWAGETLRKLAFSTDDSQRALLPDASHWLRIDHDLRLESGNTVSLTLRREPSDVPDENGRDHVQLAFMKVDGAWRNAGASLVPVAHARTAAWSKRCVDEERAILASLAPPREATPHATCAIHGFVAPWSCLLLFVPKSPEEATRIRMEQHRDQCGPRDPLIVE